MTRQLALVGVGNILLKDEGVGVKIAEILEKEGFRAGDVSYFDGGTSIFSLMPVLESFKCVILADAVRGGKKVGTVYFFTSADIKRTNLAKYSLHGMGIADELELHYIASGKRTDFKIIGVEPFEIAPGMELSMEMQRAFPKILAEIKIIINKELERDLKCTNGE
jgi:hydrogenase maturation protease